MTWERWATTTFPKDAVIFLYHDDNPISGSGDGVAKSTSVPPNSFALMTVEAEGSIYATSNQLYDLVFEVRVNGVVKQEARHRHRIIGPPTEVIHSWSVRWTGRFIEGGLLEIAVTARVPGDATWKVNALRLYGVN